MGRQLLSQEPVFATMMGRCDEILQRELGWSLLKELTADESDSRMEETSIAQPAIFAVQVSLAELWRSWGVRPTSVVGHSVGEVAAAYTAGALDLEDAVAHDRPSRSLHGSGPGQRGHACRRDVAGTGPRDSRPLLGRCLGGGRQQPELANPFRSDRRPEDDRGGTRAAQHLRPYAPCQLRVS